MKAVTEFHSTTLLKGLQAKTTLQAEGKSAEEIQTSLGEAFKLEGEKLTCFVNALEVASANTQNLKRVLIVRLNEGETAPIKSTKVEELYYVPEFLNLAPATKAAPESGRGGGRGRQGGGKKGGPKGSPWGLSPEEKAAKNKKPAGGTTPA